MNSEVDTLDRIRILSVDDHPLLREGIAAIINNQSDMVLVSQACNGAEGIRQYRECRPDVTLMDLRLPDLSGIDVVTAIRAEFGDARIIMLTTFEGDVEIQRALEAGLGDTCSRACLQAKWLRSSDTYTLEEKGSPPK